MAFLTVRVVITASRDRPDALTPAPRSDRNHSAALTWAVETSSRSSRSRHLIINAKRIRLRFYETFSGETFCVCKFARPGLRPDYLSISANSIAYAIKPSFGLQTHQIPDALLAHVLQIYWRAGFMLALATGRSAEMTGGGTDRSQPRRLVAEEVRPKTTLRADTSLTLASRNHQRIRPTWREVVMADREKTGRIVGTVAAVGVVISVLAII